MNVGDYVRTRNGYICKVVNINDFREPSMKYGVEANYLKDIMFIGDEIIDKSSPQIIDLIEVGDYVNGKKVIDVYSDYIFDYSEKFRVIRFSEIDILHNSKHIETIVTHEQFESAAYRVEE